MYRMFRSYSRKYPSDTISIVSDLVDYVSNGKRNNIKYGLINAIDILSRDNCLELTNMAEKIPTNDEENLEMSLEKVMESMFEDGKISYERILGLLVFGGFLGKKCLKNEANSRIEVIKEVIGEYIDKNLIEWINKQGGWVSNINCLNYELNLLRLTPIF